VHVTNAESWWKDGRWLALPTRGKSELHRARVPGESQGGALGASTVQIGTRSSRESNRDDARLHSGVEVKRAILPAAISDSAACRLLAKAGSREQSPRRRGDRSLAGRER